MKVVKYVNNSLTYQTIQGSLSQADPVRDLTAVPTFLEGLLRMVTWVFFQTNFNLRIISGKGIGKHTHIITIFSKTQRNSRWKHIIKGSNNAAERA